MKKIIFLMLLVAAVATSCTHRNPPCGPNGYQDPYGYGHGRPTDGTEPGNPDVSNPGDGVSIFSDYYNRYDLITTDGSVYISNNGTLVWYNKAIDRCPKLCWVDVCVVKNGYYIEVYWYRYGNLYKEVYDARRDIFLRMSVLVCHPDAPDYPYQSRIEISNSDGIVYVSLMGEGYNILEQFKM